MDIEVKIIKDIPKNEINKFEDKVVYNTTVLTREYTKSANAYPYRSGRLRASEIAAPILSNGNKSYGLSSGVGYAKRVWNYNNVNWTNPSTQPQWYYSVFRKQGASIIQNAVSRALKEI